MSKKIKIAIDAMGGENSPKKIIDGIKISLLKNENNFFYLYGNESLLKSLTKKDVENRKLPEGTAGLVITSIANDSPINSLEVNDIIVEVQKKKIRSAKILDEIIENILKSNEKTLLSVIYNNQNQRRYLGVKLK